MTADSAGAAVVVALDVEGKQLQLEAEKAKYREAIAKARQGVTAATTIPVSSVIPNFPDAPKGEVTLGEKAGALGPWRAHQLIDAAAKEIASSVRGTIAASNPNASRVLVVDNLGLIHQDWTARRVHTIITEQRELLKALGDILSNAERHARQQIDAYTQLEAAAPSSPPSAPGWRKLDDQPDTASEPSPSDVPAAGALGAAVGLVGLLRTDYSFTAIAVDVPTSELATLLTGQLATSHGALPVLAAPAGVAPAVPAGAAPAAGAPPIVEADTFSKMRKSRSEKLLAKSLRRRSATVTGLLALQRIVSPVAAEHDSMAARLTALEAGWTSAIADKKDPAVVAELRSAADSLAQLAARREAVVSESTSVVEYAVQCIKDFDAAMAALLSAADGGEPALLTAVRRERLDATISHDKITHVLYANLDSVASEAITRRSILGVSGKVRFVSAVSASWMLLDTDKGTITAGDQVSLADVLTLDVDTATAAEGGQLGGSGQAVLPSNSHSTTDPLTSLESTARKFVYFLIVALAALSLISLIAVVKAAIG